jgi:hypothetical protein
MVVKIYDHGTVVEVDDLVIIDDFPDPEVDAIEEELEVELEERIVASH